MILQSRLQHGLCHYCPLLHLTKPSNSFLIFFLNTIVFVTRLTWAQKKKKWNSSSSQSKPFILPEALRQHVSALLHPAQPLSVHLPLPYVLAPSASRPFINSEMIWICARKRANILKSEMPTCIIAASWSFLSDTSFRSSVTPCSNCSIYPPKQNKKYIFMFVK